MSETFDGKITGLPDWYFSEDEGLQKYIEKIVVEALNNSLPDAGCIWLTTEPLGIRFYLNLNDTTAEVEWRRSLADVVLEEIENWVPGGGFPVSEETKETVAKITRDLRGLADKVDAFMAKQEQSRS